MHLLKARAYQFGHSRGVTTQVQSKHIGVAEEVFLTWLEDPETIPAEYEEKLCSYFKMQPHELKQEVMVQVPFKLLQELRHRVGHIVPTDPEEVDEIYWVESEMDNLIKAKNKQLFGRE